MSTENQIVLEESWRAICQSYSPIQEGLRACGKKNGQECRKSARFFWQRSQQAHFQGYLYEKELSTVLRSKQCARQCCIVAQAQLIDDE